MEMAKLETTKKKQLLGEVYQHELDTYKDINPRIEWDYARCFKGTSLTSYVSLGIGAFLAFALNKRSTIILRTSIFVSTQFASLYL